MIKHWLVVGDLHGNCSPNFDNALRIIGDGDPSEYGVIVLGDAGFQFTHKSRDTRFKSAAEEYGFFIYVLRGNHEDRIVHSESAVWFNDPNVGGEVAFEPEFPLIRYFKDIPCEYTIGGYRCLTMPGAFSVDKDWRLKNSMTWFPDEQLSPQEMKDGIWLCSGKTYDFVLSHTCPISWMPRDLFLPMIDQSKVDYSMENYLEGIRKIIGFKVWCFGHYHRDRLERPNAQMFFQEVESMDDIFARVTQPVAAPDYKHIKSPNYYMEDN